MNPVLPATGRRVAGREQFELRAGPYTATVARRAAALTNLTWSDRPLVLDTRDAVARGAVPSPAFSGAVLAPWPNRIRDARYTFGGRRHQLPVTEVGRGCALHGLLLWQSWDLVVETGNTVTLRATVCPQPGYPFTVEVTACYQLGATGLRVDLAALNLGAETAPVGLSLHPYLVPGGSEHPMDEWQLTLPSSTVLEVDPDRLLPRRTRDVARTDFDFRAPRALAGVRLDHAFTDAGERTATLAGPDGFAVELEWDAGCPWLQVCTIDGEAPPRRRAGLAVEPMTCPPDAFNSGTDLWALAPGEERSVGLHIRSRPPAGEYPQI